MTIHDPLRPVADTEDGAEPTTTEPAAPVVVEVPVPVPTWTAGNAAWWAISVVVAAAAVTLFTVLRTAAAFSEPEPAQAILEAVLRAPTEAAVEDARAADPDAAVVSGGEDLVRFEIRADVLAQDARSAITQAVEDRATELRTEGIPVDPGATRTQTGLPRRVIESLSEQNHEVVERGVLLSAVLAGALLLFTLLQGRNDNLLMLPAGALAVAWVLVTIGLQGLDVLLDGTGPGTSQVLAIIERAAAAPRAQLTFAAAAGLLGAAAYRVMVQVQGWRRRRALERYRAEVERESSVERPAPTETPAPVVEIDGVIDLEREIVELPAVPAPGSTSGGPVRVRVRRPVAAVDERR